ncbi:MAG: SO_0444 family Cu/Zn efflux transporter [Bacteroidales bacterium]|nr:SO_0444 family Cu/Zn efflux transporter [Bacteroidales bacterium]
MHEIIHIINEMSPYLLLGFLLAGLMHAFIPQSYYSKYLAKPNFRSVLNATLFGIPLPLCSCGVIPTAMSLRKEGASKGAATSFLIATPQTGVDSIIATSSLMGVAYAIIRPIAALITALFGGTLVNVLDKDSNGNTTEQPADNHEHHNCCHHHEQEHHATFLQKIKTALQYGYVEMMEDIGKWLIIGLIVAGLITVFVPAEAFKVFEGNTALSMLLVLAIAIPMYVCATGSIPIAVALIMKGLTPGAGLVLLMAGPACNMASMLVVKKVMGTKTLVIYLASIIIGSIAFGAAIDFMQFNGIIDFTANLVNSAHSEEGSSWIAWISTGILIALLINALVINRLKGKTHCHCHEHEEEHGCHCHEHEEEHGCHCHEH